MAEASLAPPSEQNPLGLKLEVANPNLLELKVFNVLLFYLPNDSQVSVPETASQIHSILLNNLVVEQSNPDVGGVTDTVGGILHIFWDIYFLLGTQIDPKLNSGSMDCLISLVGVLKQLPSEVHTERYGRVWQDLPQMSMFLTKRWNEINIRSDDKNRAEAGKQWCNINSLIARLTTVDLVGGELSALHSIADALGYNDKRDTEFLFQCSLPAAVSWLQIWATAAKLLKACYQNQCLNSNCGGYLWTKKLVNEEDEQRGFSLERWNFWRERLVGLSKHRNANEEARGLCRTTLETMEAVEKEIEN